MQITNYVIHFYSRHWYNESLQNKPPYIFQNRIHQIPYCFWHVFFRLWYNVSCHIKQASQYLLQNGINQISNCFSPSFSVMSWSIAYQIGLTIFCWIQWTKLLIIFHFLFSDCDMLINSISNKPQYILPNTVNQSLIIFHLFFQTVIYWSISYQIGLNMFCRVESSKYLLFFSSFFQTVI